MRYIYKITTYLINYLIDFKPKEETVLFILKSLYDPQHSTFGEVGGFGRKMLNCAKECERVLWCNEPEHGMRFLI